MKKQLIYGLALVVAAPLFAQSKMLYSPKHLGSSEGQYYCYYFGRWKEARVQMVDGENRGKVAAITAISMRLDNRSYYSSIGMGKSWSQVQVQMSQGDINTFNRTFATNSTTTPTTVFKKAWSLPTVPNGFPLLKPAIWGGLKGQYVISFSTNWVYTGKGDIISDWQFTNGKISFTRDFVRHTRCHCKGRSVSDAAACRLSGVRQQAASVLCSPAQVLGAAYSASRTSRGSGVAAK